MLVRHSCAANQLSTGTVAVAICDRAVRVIVVRNGGHVSFVTVVGKEIIPISTYGFIVTWIDSPENMLSVIELFPKPATSWLKYR